MTDTGKGSDASLLAEADLTKTLSKKGLKQIQKTQLERLYELENECFERDIPVIVVFEGWDAAGKGTEIRTLTARLDPRGFKVLSTQAPRTHEKQKPWLWRFWMDIPRRGQMAIFDRSWYGRVLVERVRGLTPIPDWIRAYEEINAFERTLADDATIIVKFWLHISKEEQLRRFFKLTADPDTAWQVTAEDWENHLLYEEYQAAVEDMLASTHTDYAPWEIVPATSKHYRTYHILCTLLGRLEDALGQDVTEWPLPEELDQQAGKKKKKKKAKAEAKAKAKRKKKAKKKAHQQAVEQPPEQSSDKEAGEGLPTVQVKDGDGAAEPAADSNAVPVQEVDHA